MATLLHDAVMNPAEGNASWSQGMAGGDMEGAGETVVGGDRRSGKETSGPQSE